MRRSWLVGIVGIVVTVAGMSSARAAEPRTLDIAFHGATAQLTVVFDVKAEGLGQVEESIVVPPNAVVIGGSVRDGAGSHALALVRADAADRTLGALSAAAPGRARASFVLLSDGGDEPSVAVTILAPNPDTYTFELTFESPTCLENDTRYVAVPGNWETLLPPAMQETSLGSACGAENETWVGTPSDELSRRPPGIDRIGTAGARFAAASAQLARVEVALAGTLSAVPRDLHTVLVVDTSRSLSSDERETARAVVASYLAKAPASSVQVITYARHATALLPDWSNASTSAATIAQKLVATTPANGSELPEALRAAATWLGKTRGTRRVVILSDARVADRIAKIPSLELARILPAHTLVHVVAFDGDELRRDDNARWADLAASTEGMATSGHGADVDATLLVRPTSVDHLEIRGAHFSPVADTKHACESSLAEGMSCTWWATGRGADSVSVQGLLWNHRWTRTVTLGTRHDVHIARQARFVLDSGNPIAIAALRAARAVSSEWSLAAQWGGSGGYGDFGPGGRGGWGTICECGPYGTIGHGSGTGTAPLSPTWLHDQLAPAVKTCMRPGVSVALTVELTTSEIVDVTATVTDAVPDGKRIESCVLEAVWRTNVTPPRLDEHQTQRLTF